MTKRGNWNYPTPIRFGPGRITELADACRELSIARPLLATDPGLAALPMVDQALGTLRDGGLTPALFSDVQANPVGANVDAGVAAYRAGSCDGVIAFGGGSAIDVAKAVALMVGQDRPLWDFEDRDDWYTRADADKIAPIVAVPTTSGTGSEVGRCSVVTNVDVGIKRIIFHPKLMPARVIADPELTIGLPAKLTAAVGMDALAHNLEAYCSPGYHPMADGIALEALRLIHRALPVAFRDGANLDARCDMMAAATMGATSFQKGLGAIHSLSHPVGVALNTHHGLTNAVFMPYVLVFNRDAIAERMATLARLLDLDEPSFDGVLAWVLALRKEIGVPHTAAELGVTENHVDAFATKAIDDPTAPTNPVPLTVESLAALYRKAIAGDLN